MTDVDITLVIAVSGPSPRLGDVLKALLRDPPLARFEVLVVDGSPTGGPEIPKHPAVRLLPAHATCLPVAKGVGLREARGDLVAFLDASGPPEAGWIDRAVDAMLDPSVGAVGGAVRAGADTDPANCAIYLFEYGAFAPPLAAGDTLADLPGNDVVYRRLPLTEAAARQADGGVWKPFLHERLRARGLRFRIEPSLIVRHETAHRFPDAARSRRHYGRCFGAMRTRAATPSRRWAYRLLGWVVPLLLYWRIAGRSRRHPTTRPLLRSHRLALLRICWAWGVGEWLGSCFGTGRSCGEVR